MNAVAETAYVMCAGADSNPNYSTWMNDLGRPVEVISGHGRDWEAPANAAILITHMQYRVHDVAVLNRAMARNIPALILADGILEYRNSFENPQIASNAIFRPVIGHKLACIGRSQARIVASWGNAGKCEVVGLPRLDSAQRPAFNAYERSEDTFRLLVLTARQPGFTDAQLQVTRKSLAELKQSIDQLSSVEGRRIEVTWRICGGLDEAIGVQNSLEDVFGNELLQMLPNFDAVITTPSTTQLEAALCGLPVALLNYHPCPDLVPAVWNIRGPDQINPVLTELANPPAAKMDIQQSFLFDSLECASDAKPRLIKLINGMVEIADADRRADRPIRFPPHLLESSDYGEHPASVPLPRAVVGKVPLDTADPSRAPDDRQSVDALRVELAHAHLVLDGHEAEVLGLQRTIKISSNRLERMTNTAKTSRGELHAERRTRKKADRRIVRLTKKIERATTQNKKQKATIRKLAQARKRVQVVSKKRAGIVARSRNRIGQLKRNLDRQSKQRTKILKAFEQRQKTIGRNRKQIQALQTELNDLRGHWLIGFTIRLCYRPKSDQLPAPHVGDEK